MPTATELSMAEKWQAKLEAEAHVEVRKDELVIEGGFSSEDADGNDEADYPAFLSKGVVVLTGHRIDDTDKESEGLSPSELIAEVLPDVDYDLTDPYDREAWAALTRRLWNGITDPRKTGKTQRALPKPLVLIRKTVQRPDGPTKVAFVTGNGSIQLDDSVQPVIDEVYKVAGKVHEQASMVTDRNPAIAGKVNKAITAGMKRASANARVDKPELEAGDGS
jgi:hypothetical protein